VTFAQPWAIALVALAAPIIYAYMHRKHRMKRSVASAILLRAIKDERPAAQRKRARVRHLLSLALVLAALVAALFALAGPAASNGDGRRIVIVLDRSASMATREAERSSTMTMRRPSPLLAAGPASANSAATSAASTSASDSRCRTRARLRCAAGRSSLIARNRIALATDRFMRCLRCMYA